MSEARRLFQVFLAPGAKDEPLPLEGSPWHIGHKVSIPKEHWETILDFAETFDIEKTDILRLYSNLRNENQIESVFPSGEELREIIAFIQFLIQAIEYSAPLTPETTPVILENYSNEEHMRMLRAVFTVLEVSASLQQPFKSWVE
jgi:hypothetical protein